MCSVKDAETSKDWPRAWTKMGIEWNDPSSTFSYWWGATWHKSCFDCRDDVLLILYSVFCPQNRQQSNYEISGRSTKKRKQTERRPRRAAGWSWKLSKAGNWLARLVVTYHELSLVTCHDLWRVIVVSNLQFLWLEGWRDGAGWRCCTASLPEADRCVGRREELSHLALCETATTLPTLPTVIVHSSLIWIDVSWIVYCMRIEKMFDQGWSRVLAVPDLLWRVPTVGCCITVLEWQTLGCFCTFPGTKEGTTDSEGDDSEGEEQNLEYDAANCFSLSYSVFTAVFFFCSKSNNLEAFPVATLSTTPMVPGRLWAFDCLRRANEDWYWFCGGCSTSPLGIWVTSTCNVLVTNLCILLWKWLRSL